VSADQGFPKVVIEADESAVRLIPQRTVHGRPAVSVDGCRGRPLVTGKHRPLSPSSRRTRFSNSVLNNENPP